MSKIIKIALGDDMRRKTYQDITFDAFKQDVINTFNLENGSFIIKYQDKIINSDELFLYIINNTQSTIKFDIEKRSFQDLYDDEEIKVKDVPKQNIPENNNNNNNTNNVSNPKMPNIFSTLFGGNNQQSNPLSMLMGFLPGMMGGNNNNNNNNVGFSGMFPALMQNLPNILKILTENLPKEKLQELIVTILKSIPREQLISVLKTALSSPQVQESIISTLMSSLDKMIESPNESPIPQKENTNQNVIDEKKRIEENEQKKQEETRRRIEELKRQKEEIKKKQEEELLKQQQETSKLEEEKKIEEQKKIDEEIKKKKLEEFLKHQENLKKQYEEQKKQEEKKKEEERLRYEEMMKEQEERKKKIEEEDIKRKQEEENKKRLEEEHRIKLLELQEIERKKVEELKLLEQKKLEEENLKKLEEESKRNTFMIKLQSNGIPYECYRNAEEIGLIESYGIEKVTDLLIKHRGNVEMVANELFN